MGVGSGAGSKSATPSPTSLPPTHFVDEHLPYTPSLVCLHTNTPAHTYITPIFIAATNIPPLHSPPPTIVIINTKPPSHHIRTHTYNTHTHTLTHTHTHHHHHPHTHTHIHTPPRPHPFHLPLPHPGVVVVVVVMVVVGVGVCGRGRADRRASRSETICQRLSPLSLLAPASRPCLSLCPSALEPIFAACILFQPFTIYLSPLSHRFPPPFSLHSPFFARAAPDSPEVLIGFLDTVNKSNLSSAHPCHRQSILNLSKIDIALIVNP